LSAGRPAPKQPEAKRQLMMLQELEAMLRASKEMPDPTQTR
jgi:hypothetical protein